MSYCSGSDELLFFLGLHVEKHASAELPDGFMARFWPNTTSLGHVFNGTT
jgi:hypothetical protein